MDDIFYSKQGDRLDEREGGVDLEKATYNNEYSGLGTIRAQKMLYSIIGTHQIIWCFQKSVLEFHHTSLVEFLHTINFSENDEYWVIDQERWDMARNFSDEDLEKGLLHSLCRDAIKNEVVLDSDQLLIQLPLEHSAIINIEQVTRELAKKYRVR